MPTWKGGTGMKLVEKSKRRILDLAIRAGTRRPRRVYDKKVTLSGKVAHAAVRAAALNEERLREA